MTNIEISRLHAKNKAKLQKALTQIKLSLNLSIKEGNEILEYVNVRLYILLTVAKIEATLNFIIYFYEKQISPSERAVILNESSQENKWRKLIEIAFRRNYLNGNSLKELNLLNLGHSAFYRYQYLMKILEEEIIVSISIRNKLAHGQWAVAFNNDGSDKQQDITAKIWKLTKKDTIILKNVVDNFLNLIEFLVASKNKFEEKYDLHVNKIETTKDHMKTKFQWVIDEMKKRYNSFDRISVKK